MSEEMPEYRLTILSEFRKDAGDHVRTFVKAQCVCGKIFEAIKKCVVSGNTTSCGCRRKNTLRKIKTKHREFLDHGWTKELRAYYAIKKRCVNPRDCEYKNYGGRGIEYRFDTFEQFLACVGRAPSAKHSIDRIDVNGHYEPGNVRWATVEQQSLNKRNTAYEILDGIKKPVIEWCRLYGITRGTYGNRKKLGWPVKQIFNIEKRVV